MSSTDDVAKYSLHGNIQKHLFDSWALSGKKSYKVAYVRMVFLETFPFPVS